MYTQQGGYVRITSLIIIINVVIGISALGIGEPLVGDRFQIFHIKYFTFYLHNIVVFVCLRLWSANLVCTFASTTFQCKNKNSLGKVEVGMLSTVSNTETAKYSSVFTVPHSYSELS